MFFSYNMLFAGVEDRVTDCADIRPNMSELCEYSYNSLNIFQKPTKKNHEGPVGCFENWSFLILHVWIKILYFWFQVLALGGTWKTQTWLQRNHCSSEAVQ